MAITEVNLGSTFKDFLEALNNASENTNGIIEGEKRIKKLKLGDTSEIQEIEEIEDLQPIKVIFEKADGYSLQTGAVEEIGLSKSTGINSKSGRFSIFSRKQERDINGLVTVDNEALIGVTDEGTISLLTTDNKNDVSSQIKLNKDKITFSASNVDFSNANVTGLPIPDIDTSNLVTLDSEQIISGKKIFENFALFSKKNIVWSEDLITNQVDLSGVTLVFSNNTPPLIDMPYFRSSGGYMLVGSSSGQIDLIDANSILYAQLYSNGWNGDSITLPNDFGYIVAFIASNAVELLNETFPSIPAKILFDENKYISMPNDNGILATQEWVNEQGFGSGGSIDTTADITWEGDHRFNGNVLFFADCAMDYINCDTEANFNGSANFHGNVDFSGANVTGLPSGGGSLDLDADYNWNGNHTFNNGITLNGALTLANNGIIEDSEEQLLFYKNGSLWVGTEEGGEILITNDNTKIESYNGLDLFGNEVSLFANNSIEILAGENDDTSFYISPTGMDVTANNGNIDFSTNNQGIISFNARSEESESYISIYDTTIEYGAQNHAFFGTVDFSDATVTGLQIGGGLTKTKVTLAELRLMLTNNSTNYGKLIQFVYKGSSTQQIASMINAVGIVQITKQNSLYKKTTSIEMTESAMSGTTYILSVSYSAAITPFLNYQTWERNFDDGTTVVDDATQFNITDSTFDIYVIGD